MTRANVPNTDPAKPLIAEYRDVGRWRGSIYRPGGKANRVSFCAQDANGQWWKLEAKGSWLAGPNETGGDPPERLEEIWATATTEEAIEALVLDSRASSGLPPWIQPRT